MCYLYIEYTMTTNTTVRFSNIEKLKAIQARVYLSTQQNLSKQQILDLAIDIIDANIELLEQKISPAARIFSSEEIDDLLETIVSDWGEGTENSSETIDDILYGEKS